MTIRRAARGYRWLVVTLLMMAFALSFIDRQILVFMVGPMRRDLGITDTGMSLLMGASFAVVYALTTIPMGRLADTSNRRNLIVSGVVCWSLMTLLAGTARNYTQLFLARIGVGAGEAALQPAAYSLVAAYFPAGQRALAMSLCAAGIYIGSGLAFLLGGLLAQYIAVNESVELPLLGVRRGWQAVLLMLGLGGIAFGLLLTLIREPPRARSDSGPLPIRAVIDHLRRRRRVLLPHHLGFAMLALSSYGVGAWVPAYFARSHGWSMAEIGWVYGLAVMIAGTAGMLTGGALYDRWRAAGDLAAVARLGRWTAALTLLMSVIYQVAPGGVMAAFFLVPAIFAISLPIGAAPASIQDAMPESLRGQASAVYLLVVNLLGLGLGPTAVALFTDYVFRDDEMLRYSMLSVTTLCCCSALWLLKADRFSQP